MVQLQPLLALPVLLWKAQKRKNPQLPLLVRRLTLMLRIQQKRKTPLAMVIFPRRKKHPVVHRHAWKVDLPKQVVENQKESRKPLRVKEAEYLLSRPAKYLLLLVVVLPTIHPMSGKSMSVPQPTSIVYSTRWLKKQLVRRWRVNGCDL